MKATEIVEKLKSVLLSSDESVELQEEVQAEAVAEIEVAEATELSEEVQAEDEMSPEDSAEDSIEEPKYVTKDELEAAMAEMKAMYDQLMEKMGSEEMAVEVPSENLSAQEEVELSAQEEAGEPITHSPESSVEGKTMTYFSDVRPESQLERIFAQLNQIKK